jgi:hypothetical protein
MLLQPGLPISKIFLSISYELSWFNGDGKSALRKESTLRPLKLGGGALHDEHCEFPIDERGFGDWQRHFEVPQFVQGNAPQ